MSSKRCREPLPLQLGNRKSLERHGKSRKLMLDDKQTTCDRKWDEMDHELLICIMKRIQWYKWIHIGFAVCKSWLSAFLDVLFPPGDVLDLRLLDDLHFKGRVVWNSRRFYHCLKLHLDRRSPNHYTKLILCECILPYKAYHAIAQRLPSVTSFVSPAKMSFYCAFAKGTYNSVGGTKLYTRSYNFVSDAMCRYWKNLEEAQCHYSMLWDLGRLCKSIRNLTVIGSCGRAPPWLPDCIALAIGIGFPLLDRLSILSCRVTLTGMSMILEDHKNLTYLDMGHTECVPEEAILTRLYPTPGNYSWPKDLPHQIARVLTFLTWNGKNCPDCTHLYARLL